MKKFGNFFIIFLLLLVGCQESSVLPRERPMIKVEIAGEIYNTAYGSYCWTTKCVDTGGAVELVKGREPMKVKKGKMVKLIVIDYTEPSESSLRQIHEEKEEKIQIKHLTFITPSKAGVYYYDYFARWVSETEEHVSKGSASYAFALEVE